MPLSERVYCVAIAFKWLSEKKICIKLCIKLEHFSEETIQMIPKSTAMGNWWLAASSQQYACPCIMSLQSFLAKHQITQVTPAPYSQDLVPCDFWLFPKLKSPLKGKIFQITHKIQENTMGSLMAIRTTVWGPKVPTLKRTEASLSFVQCVFYLVSSSINVSIFHIPWLDTFWTDLIFCTITFGW